MPTDILTRNNVTISGRGTQPILFGHGFGCDQSFWRFVAPAFEDHYRVILFDYVGSGRSDRTAYDPQRYGSLRGYVQDVQEICTALQLTDVIFVGHSISAVIGMLASIQNPRLFKQMVLIGASPSYQNAPPDYMGGYNQSDLEGLLDMLEKNHLGWAQFLAPVAMKNPERPELAIELETSFGATEHFILHQFAEVTFMTDVRSELAKVAVPALIMQPRDDAFVPIPVAQYLHRQLAGSSLALMNATGHFPHLSGVAETIQLIREYISPLVATAES